MRGLGVLGVVAGIGPILVMVGACGSSGDGPAQPLQGNVTPVADAKGGGEGPRRTAAAPLLDHLQEPVAPAQQAKTAPGLAEFTEGLDLLVAGQYVEAAAAM